MKQAKASLLAALLAQGESLIRGFMTDSILLDRPQVGRMVVCVVCAAFQAIAEHARSDRADDEG
jgi:hypothetical protein